MSTFGERLKMLREEKMLTQDALGKIFDLYQSTIGYYETNKKEPSQKTVLKLTDFFNVSTDYLLGRTNNPIITGSTQIPDQLLRACLATKELPEEQVAKLAAVLELLINQSQRAEQP